MEEPKAKKRCENFDDDEKTCLIELISKRRNNLENPNNSCQINSKKKEEWSNLLNEYAAAYPTKQRTIDQLKKLWTKLKLEAKQKNDKLKLERSLTGGGPQPTQLSIIDEAVLDVNPTLTFTMNNQYDSDSNFHSKSVSFSPHNNDNNDSNVENIYCDAADNDLMEAVANSIADPSMTIALPNVKINTDTNAEILPLPKSIQTMQSRTTTLCSSQTSKTPALREVFSAQKFDKEDIITLEHRKRVQLLDIQIETAQMELEKKRKLFDIQIECAQYDLECKKTGRN